MRAAVVYRYGPPENLQYGEWPEPPPGPGEVVVRVRAIGVNFADLFQRMGLYPGTPKPPFVPGFEVAGEIESAPAVPGNAEAFPSGTRVAALTRFYAYAEKVAVPASQLFRIPDAMNFEDACAIPVNYLTAYHSMFHMGNLQPGERILIHNAAGGVGVAAVQLALARGLVVFGTAGPSKQDFLRQLGVQHPIDYSKQDFVREVRSAFPDGIEMVMDPIGGESFKRSERCLGPTGRLVIYGFSASMSPSGKRSLWRMLTAFLQTPRYHPLRIMRDNRAYIGVQLGMLKSRGHILAAEMRDLFELYAAGRIKPVIGKTFPLAEAAEAHRFIHARKNIGKVVLTVA